jgi:type I restriction enzyme M protein
MSEEASPKGARRVADRLATLLLDDPRRRSDFRPAEGALLSLALDAALWRSDRFGTALPGRLLHEMSMGLPDLGEDARRLQRDWLDNVQSDEDLTEYIPALAYRFGDRGQMFEWLSSDSMREVAEVAALAGRRPGEGPLRIFDPAAGSGSMLFNLAKAASRLGYVPRAFGAELNPAVATLASAMFCVAGKDVEIEVANSLVEDPFPDIQVELAISQPPFGLDWDGEAQLVEERHRSGWYPFGLPPRSDSSWLFASRLIEKLVPGDAGGGRAVTFVALGALRSPSSSGIREQVLEQDLVEAVIALPAGLTQASVPVFALVFNNRKSGRRQERIQLVDLRGSSESSRLREAPRRLRPVALDALRQALQSTRDGIITRTVPREHFLRARHTIRSTAQTDPSENGQRPTWYLDLPRDIQIDAELAARYGPVKVEASDPGQTRCDFDIEVVFDIGARSLRGWLTQTGWPATRLSALLLEPPEALSGSTTTDLDLTDRVLLPTSESHPATVGAPAATAEDDRVRRRLALRLDVTKLLPDFAVGWLNSSIGLEVRARALAAASSGLVIHAMRTEPRTLLRFCDELTVPLPPLSVQREFAVAEARMSAAVGLVAAARREAWSEPSKIGDVTRRFDPLFDRSLTSWIADLPYPVGSALWAFETKRRNPDAAHRQAFLVWEAYAAFFAAVLMSALAQDPVLKEDELPRLRQALAQAGLDMTRATFGSWSLIVQRLSNRFRARMRDGNADDRAAVLETFGGVSPGTLERILDAKIVDLITDANSRRNAWTGHSGSISDAEMTNQTAYLTDRMEELRELIGGAWRELLCVRAGDAYMKGGQVVQKVELVLGASAPFRQAELTVGAMMERDELYLCGDGAAQPLRLQHFVVLRSTPGNARYTSYFYNRRDGNEVRLVTYQLAETSEVTEDVAEFADAIDGLARMHRAGFPPA